MFERPVYETAFTKRSANEFFRDQIVVSDSIADKSLVSVLRAIVFPRMRAGERLIVDGNTVYYRAEDLSFDKIRGAFGRFASFKQNNLLYFLDVPRACSDYAEFIDKAAKLWLAENKDFAEDERAYRYLVSGGTVRVLVNEKSRTTLVIYSSCTHQLFHGVLRTMPSWFPWYIKGGIVSKKEAAVLDSLLYKDGYDSFLMSLQDIAKEYNFPYLCAERQKL